MSKMSNHLLEVENLGISFFTKAGEQRAVDGVSFYVDEGETLGLVGESGCGKTVTGLSLLRLLPDPPGKIVSGRIVINGIDIRKLSDKAMRQVRGRLISMILQDPMTSLNPVYTIGDQISESVRLRKDLDESQVESEVINALRLLKIPAPERRLKDFPFQMSGGMRQRVVGAIAMSCYPRVLIADEPTTALDATIQAQYIHLFKDVQRQTNVAIIFITHDFGVVAKMCDRVAVMYSGKMVETATTSALFKHPLHPYSIALINSVPRLDRKDDRLYSIEGQPPSLANLPQGCRFYPRCNVHMEICETQQPQLIEVEPNHSVACWRVK